MTSNPQRRRRRSDNHLLKRMSKAFRPYLRWRFLVTGGIVFILVMLLIFWILLTDARVQLNNAQDGLQRVVNSISTSSGTELTLNDFRRLEASISELSLRIQTARGRIGLLSLALNLNADWKASAEALAISEQLAISALDMLSGLEPALSYMVEGSDDEALTGGSSSAERIVELLDLGRNRFASAASALRLAEAQLNEVDISSLSPELILELESLRDYHAQLWSFNTALINAEAMLTSVMGLEAEKSYLVLAQNNDEIRPSGGYIGTYGWFTVDRGRIIDFAYYPTTATSPNPPNPDFLDSFSVPDWWIRYGEPIYAAWDGSWYADFPSTAQLAINYYNAGANPHAPIDGLIAIDISGFELLLGAIGAVEVPEDGIIVTAENFRDVVYDIRAYGQGGVEPHKQFLSRVYSAIFDEWRNLETERSAALFGALLEAIQSRHLMLYFADADMNAVLGDLGWNGAQVAAIEHDYMMVADANLGNKSNQSVIRSFTYDVEIGADGLVQSRLSLSYEYFDALASNDPAINPDYHGAINYNNLMQVFLPLEANLLSVSSIELEAIPSASHQHLVGRTNLAYDSSQRYQFEYEIPNLIDSFGNYRRYRLLIQKQAGARLENGIVQIILPENAQIVRSSPAPNESFALERVILDYRIELDGDIWLELVYQQ